MLDAIDEWWVRTANMNFTSSSYARQLAEEKWSCRVKEVRSLPSWQQCGHYHATAMGIKLSYFCIVQLPAGDKRCLAEPVNLPASLGICPRHINWCMHFQHYCLTLTQQNIVPGVSGLVEFDFESSWIIAQCGQCIWWSTEHLPGENGNSKSTSLRHIHWNQNHCLEWP